MCLPKGSPCLETIPPTPCTLFDDVDVCKCPAQMVFFGGDCVVPDEVGCLDDRGNAKEVCGSLIIYFFEVYMAGNV